MISDSAMLLLREETDFLYLLMETGEGLWSPRNAAN